jgi:Endonuclease-reverse transcriptase
MIPLLRQHLRQHVQDQKYNAIIMAGDFNLHHPLWNAWDYDVHDAQGDELIEMMADAGLKLLLPAGTITYSPTGSSRRGTAIDLVWGTDVAENAVIKCQIAENYDHTSDHLPIETTLDFASQQLLGPDGSTELPFNYANTDWNSLEYKIATYLPEIISTDPGITTPDMIDKFASDITDSISHAVSETTPCKKECQSSKRWWNDDLTQLRRETNRLRKVYRRTRNVMSGLEWRNEANEYKSQIKIAKQKTWREFVEEADERTIWTVKKYIDSTPTQAYIPTLNDTATSNEAKAAQF